MKTLDSLDSIVSRALQQIKYSYYDKNKTLFEMHFGEVKVGHLDSDGKLLLIAKDQYVDLLNARWLQPVLAYLQAGKLDVHQVVFVSASEYARAASSDILSPLPEYTEGISGAILDKMSPLPKTVSSVTVTNSDPQEPAGDDKTFSVEIEYSGEYDQIVQPERIIALPRYFLCHIQRMGVENAWLYVGFRQAAYQAGLHAGTRLVSIPAPQISRWAGVHKATFWRRIGSPQTWEGLKGFVKRGRPGDWIQNAENGKPHREPNRYTVSMTIPLNPGDVTSLRSYLIKQAENCGIEDAVKNALSVPLEELIPGNLVAKCDPMTVYQVVTSLGGSSRSAGLLQAHLMPYHDVIILTQYFVENWMPRLGEASSWMIVWLRSLGGEKGWATASVKEIMDLTGVSRDRTVRDWLRNEVVRLFVCEDPRRTSRGIAGSRTFFVRSDEPMDNELDAVATIRNDQLVAVVTQKATIGGKNGKKQPGSLELVADAIIRNDELDAVATIGEFDLLPDWTLLRRKLVANATVKESINKNLLKLSINESSTLLTINESINKRGAKEKIYAHPIPGESQEGQRQQGAVDDTNTQSIRASDDVPEMQTNQGEVEGAEVEPADPQELFQRILKQAEVAPKIQHRFQGKPFYPFLCWLIYGTSREKIEDPIGFAISRYDQGLPESQVIKDLARDLDGLLDDLDYFENFWSLPTLLAQVFESNTSRVKLLAKILTG